ncbi:hypothetical protein [Butyrivibrio sp. VCB2006]|uniref:hypothetical protein n=1 Tax=Butyrivibrio sp. VCB2006 TaxID=1280679 RepID=UPI000401DA9A|nr:hypothetical protein [Butyrivibrio sp. VCB2006]
MRDRKRFSSFVNLLLATMIISAAAGYGVRKMDLAHMADSNVAQAVAAEAEKEILVAASDDEILDSVISDTDLKG